MPKLETALTSGIIAYSIYLYNILIYLYISCNFRVNYYLWYAKPLYPTKIFFKNEII